MKFSDITLAEGEALAVRTSKPDGSSYSEKSNGFKWPKTGIVECPDWNPEPVCGGGLHGLLDGDGDYPVLSMDNDALWQIVKVIRKDCVEIDHKVKFPRCEVLWTGNMPGAMAILIDYWIMRMPKVSDKTDERAVGQRRLLDEARAASGDRSKLAASGYGSQLAASGDGSQLAASGDRSQLAASGYGSQLAASGDGSQLAASGDGPKLAASGYGSKLAASGYRSQLAASGYGSKLAASGYRSQLAASGYGSQLAASGDGSQLAASGDGPKLAASGYRSQLAASGYRSQLAASGDRSKLAASGYGSQLAASGDGSQLAASGKKSIAMASGRDSVASAGEDGCIALSWWDNNAERFRVTVGYVGEGIKANVSYRLNGKGEFKEVK